MYIFFIVIFNNKKLKYKKYLSYENYSGFFNTFANVTLET